MNWDIYCSGRSHIRMFFMYRLEKKNCWKVCKMCIFHMTRMTFISWWCCHENAIQNMILWYELVSFVWIQSSWHRACMLLSLFTDNNAAFLSTDMKDTIKAFYSRPVMIFHLWFNCLMFLPITAFLSGIVLP